MLEKDRTRRAATRLEDPGSPATSSRRSVVLGALVEVVFPLGAETECEAALAGNVMPAAEKV